MPIPDKSSITSINDMNYQAICKQFQLCPQYGFVTHVGERESLKWSSPYISWIELAKDCPALTATGRIRPLVDAVPI